MKAQESDSHVRAMIEPVPYGDLLDVRLSLARQIERVRRSAKRRMLEQVMCRRYPRLFNESLKDAYPADAPEEILYEKSPLFAALKGKPKEKP